MMTSFRQSASLDSRKPSTAIRQCNSTGSIVTAEILRELALARMINRGIQDSDVGRTISDDEM